MARRRPDRPKPFPLFRPAFEALEARDVPATILWDVAARPTGGFWNVQTNWVGGNVPTAGDDVVINLTMAGTVEHNAKTSAEVGSLTTSSFTTFDVNKGTVTIAASGATGVLAGPVNVASGATLRADAGAKVQLAANAVVTIDGTLSVDSPASFVAERGPSSDDLTTLISGSTGLITLKDAVLTETSTGLGTTRIQVYRGGRFQSQNSTLAWTRINFDNAGDLAVGDITTTAFDTQLFTPVELIPVFVGNPRFGLVGLYGPTVQKSLTLAPLGLDPTNQRYAFRPDDTFTVTENTTLRFAAGAKVQLTRNANVLVNGTLSVNDPESFIALRGTSSDDVTSLSVAAGGYFKATGAVFSSGTGDGVTRVTVASGGKFESAGSTFGWDQLTLDPDSLIDPGAVTTSSFDTTLTTPARHVPALAGNSRFRDVVLTTGTSDPTLDLAPLGVDASNQRYIFPRGTFTVAAGTALNVTAGTKVLFAPGATVAVNGTLGVDAPESFVGRSGKASAGGVSINVGSGGLFRATNASLTRTGGDQLSAIRVESGGKVTGTGNSFGWDSFDLADGSKAGLRYNFFNTTLSVSSGTKVGPNTIRNNDFSGVTVVASGATGGTIDLTNNYWGTTVAAAIDARITDELDAATLPLVNYLPLLTNRPVQTLSAAHVAASYSVNAQTLALSATLRSPSASGLVAVNEGTATFTVFDGVGGMIGTPRTVAVAAGTADATYTLPAGTNAGMYTIEVAFSGTAVFAASPGNSQSLTVNPVTTVTAGSNVVTAYAVGGQSVTASATVNSAAGFVDVGSVVFTLLSGSTVLTTSGAIAVVNGTASGALGVPAGLTAGAAYTIRAAYTGTTNLTDSTSSGGTLTIAPAATTAATGPATTTFTVGTQTLSLRATVGSSAGAVNAGTVRFTVLQGTRIVGTPADATVANGAAALNYVLPVGTGAGSYEIRVEFTGTPDFATSSTTATLIVERAATTTIGTSASVPFSPTVRGVRLTAALSSAAGIVTGGFVTFTVRGGSGKVVGTPTTAPVVAGTASADVLVPGGTTAGTYRVEVSYAGTADLVAAVDASTLLTIAPLSQAINFTGLSPVRFGSAPLALAATGGASGNPVLYRIVSGPGTISGTGLAVLGAGSVVVEAVQTGNENYTAATPVRQTLVVNRAPLAVRADDLSAVAGGARPAFTFTVVGLVNGDGPGVVTGVRLSTDAASDAPVGTYAIRADGGTASNYDLIVTPGRLTLTAAPVVPPIVPPVPPVLPPVVPPVLPPLSPPRRFAVGSDLGTPAVVQFFNSDGSVRSTFAPFGANFTGGVRTASADINGDGVDDIVVGTGPGIATQVRILDGVTGSDLFSISPFEAAFQAGVFIAVGDITGDGVPDLVVTPDEGGGPRARVFDGKTGGQIADFFGIDDPAFRGGARVAVGDLNGDGKAELIVSAGFGGGPRVTIWDGAKLSAGDPNGAAIANFFAFEPALRNGSYVAAGDVTGDGTADAIFGAGPGGGPRVRIFTGAGLIGAARAIGTLDDIPQLQVANFFGGDVDNRSGIRVTVKNLDGDRFAEVLVGSGAGAGNRVTAYAGKTVPVNGTPPTLLAFDAFEGTGGVFVG